MAGNNYSDAYKGSGITPNEANFARNEANFLECIKDPNAKIPNTKMTFAGIEIEDEAKNLWAHLKQCQISIRTSSSKSEAET